MRKPQKLQYNFDTREFAVPEDKTIISRDWKKKWIIYTRVSTEEQKRKWSWIEAQKIDCEIRAKNNDVEIIWYYKDEAEVWANLWRKGFIEAIWFLEKVNKKNFVVDYFICWATSRFSRSPKINKSFDMVARVEATWAKLVAVWNWGIQETQTEEWLMSLTLNFLVDALESMRWKKRVRYWTKWKIYSWLRPFPAVPVWYKRIVDKEWWKEIKYLVLDEPNASIVKEWFELFAEWVLLTKQQLFEFFEEKGLTSNSQKNKTWKLHRSILDPMLENWKLLVYTWNITYPERWITEIIPAKHPAIISPDTMHKILLRLEKDYGVTNHQKRKYDQDADQYPLKRILLCPECNTGVTKRKSLSHTWDYHHYYWCNHKGCKLHKKWLPREESASSVETKITANYPTKTSRFTVWKNLYWRTRETKKR